MCRIVVNDFDNFSAENINDPNNSSPPCRFIVRFICYILMKNVQPFGWLETKRASWKACMALQWANALKASLQSNEAFTLHTVNSQRRPPSVFPAPVLWVVCWKIIPSEVCLKSGQKPNQCLCALYPLFSPTEVSLVAQTTNLGELIMDF